LIRRIVDGGYLKLIKVNTFDLGYFETSQQREARDVEYGNIETSSWLTQHQFGVLLMPAYIPF